MYRKLREVWTCGFEIRERTEKQTDTLIAALCSN